MPLTDSKSGTHFNTAMAPNIDLFDGGPPVDRKRSSGSGTSGSHNSNVDDLGSIKKKSEYYDGEDFDDMIANVMDGHPCRSDDDDLPPVPLVDANPNDGERRTSNETSDLDEMNSLGSDDISGGSDVSDIEKANEDRRNRRSFTPPPLINDDESTVDMRPPAPVNQTVSSYVDALNRQQMNKHRILKVGILFVLLGVVLVVVLAVVLATPGKNDDDGQDGGEMNELNNSRQIGIESELGVFNATTRSPSSSPILTTNASSPNIESELDVFNPTTRSPSSSPILTTNAPSPNTMSVRVTAPPTITPSLSPLMTESPSLPPQTSLPTRRPTSPVPTEAIISIMATEAPIVLVTPAPVSFEPSLQPTPSPMTESPTLEPVTPQPTPYPTPLWTPNPTRPPTTLWPTPYPTRKPPTNPPTPQPTPKPFSPTPPSSPTGSSPTGSSSDYYCARVSYTENWNELLDFDCELPCPEMLYTVCPEGHQCKTSEGFC